MKGNRALRLLATVVTIVVLACSLSLFAFAESTFSIPDGTKTVSPGMVPDDTTTVNIPNSVVAIESGAFANCKGLNIVNIDNISGSVLYDASAFYGGTISVRYLKANVPTSTVTTTEPATMPETTTEPETEPETEVVIDATPFAAAKQELSDVDVWNQLVDNAGPLESPQDTSTVLSKVIAYGVTGIVCIGAVALCVIKFKK